MSETNTKSKRLKHKEDLRRKILEVAKELFLKHGYDSISIRKIADKIGISPTTIYLYYQDKSDVIYALHQEGFKMLATQFAVLRNVEEPFERLKAMGKSYIEFAMENRDFYELMFIMREPIEFVNKNYACEWEEGGAAFEALLVTVADCKAKGYFKQADLHAMSLYVWATIHGICSLKLQGHLDHVVNAHFPEKEQQLSLEKAFDTLVLNLKSIQ
ncbi:TetR/AcrR family transcriptional regulator [Pedobacter chitinilyticus]|uniref:TetR/AcrR family transcriptional regulator n=1 Tax=Pedobacter chitinilyticus TaxID=2233776 RepID=A0A3S3SPP4_9SPHI|nr:TetR/AcrR family transcriptional regulator [Pedobacter chitinilyticus]RWU04463.1 TetR/AcrR family transcriptional regulator [Pedobacter chitinilyticus]